MKRDYSKVRTLSVNKECEINDGILKGYRGVIVAYDYLANEVVVRIDDVTQVIVTSERVNQ